jgi:hypothetical protein
MLQQEKNNTADVQRGKVNITGFIYIVAKVALAVIYFRPVGVISLSFAANAPPLTSTSTAFTPPKLAA